eukprot:3288833-Pleurochrysis_carterae.AAC.1
MSSASRVATLCGPAALERTIHTAFLLFNISIACWQLGATVAIPRIVAIVVTGAIGATVGMNASAEACDGFLSSGTTCQAADSRMLDQHAWLTKPRCDHRDAEGPDVGAEVVAAA